MASILIRDICDDDLARIDAHAIRLGLSRTEYVRRRLHQDARRAVTPVTVDDLTGLGEVCADLENDEIIRQAWSSDCQWVDFGVSGGGGRRRPAG